MVSISHRVPLYCPLSCSSTRPRWNLHTSSYGSLVLAVYVEDRFYKFISLPHDGSSTSLTRASLPAVIAMFYIPFPSPTFAQVITKTPVVCYRHCRRGTIRSKAWSWKTGWSSKRSSDGEGISTWSVLLFVTVIDPQIFNSSDAYPSNPRQRDFSGKRNLSSGLLESLSPAIIASLTPPYQSRPENAELGGADHDGKRAPH